MKFVVNPDDIEAWEIGKGASIKSVTNGEKMNTIMTFWEPGSDFPLHSHHHEQMGIGIRGESIFTIDGNDYLVKKGDVYTIPSNVPHTQRNDGNERAVCVEWFSPIREDLLQKKFEQKILD